MNEQLQVLADVLANGGVYSVASVEVNPDVTLSRWSVMEATKGNGEVSRHFVGYDVYYRDGRASTGIIDFDKEAMCGTTKSGRVYKLQGNPGFNSDASYVWGTWKHINGIVSDKDVTEEYKKA